MIAFRALLLALLLLPGAAAAEADLRVLAHTYRVDLGSLEPGAERAGHLTLSNPGHEAILVRLVPEGSARFVQAADEVSIPPGASLDVPYTYRVPADATPGHHGEGLKLLPRASTDPRGVGTLTAGTAIVFTSRTTAIGVSAIEAPRSILPGEPVNGTIVLVSTWNASTNASALVEWRDASGAMLAKTPVGPVVLDPGGTARVAYALSAPRAGSGAHAIVARVEASLPPAPLAGAFTQTFHVGKREASFALAGVDDLRDGFAGLRYVLDNTGDVPVTITPRFVLMGADGRERVVTLDPVTLAPGERREATHTLALDAGRFQVTMGAEGAEEVHLTAPDEKALDLTMRPPPPPRADILGTALVVLAASVAIALAVLAWRSRARLRAVATHARIALASRLRPRPRDPYDALFAQLEPGEAPRAPAPLPPSPPARASRAVASAPPTRAAALLLHLDGFGADPAELARLSVLCAGWNVEARYAYTRAQGEGHAADLARDLAAAGFVPRIALPGREPHVRLSVDAMREAHAGRAILLATRDGVFRELEAALVADGHVVEVVGLTPGVALAHRAGVRA